MNVTVKPLTTLLLLALRSVAVLASGRLGPLNDPKSPENTTLIGDGSNDIEKSQVTFGDIYPLLAPILVLICCGYAAMREIKIQRDLRATRQTMTERRQQQRESSRNEALSEDEKAEDDKAHSDARYELFMKNFHFQQVLPDLSNISSERVRNTTVQIDEESPREDLKTEIDIDVDDETVVHTHTVPRRLYRFRLPEPKDECCICLEAYTEGETICAPVTTNCIHCFHKDCIYEWIKKKNRCPLCRVELLKD